MAATPSPEPRITVGVDIVSVDRIERLLRENGEVIDRTFTSREQSYCAPKKQQAAHLAGRFAAKEAVLKAFGTGLGSGMNWTDVEIVNQLNGRPRVHLHQEAAAVADREQLRQIDVSISHTGDIAIAHAVAAWGVPCGST